VRHLWANGTGLVSGAGSVTVEKPTQPGTYHVIALSERKHPFHFEATITDHHGVLYLRSEFNTESEAWGIPLATIDTGWLFERVEG